MKSFLEGRPVLSRHGLPAERIGNQLPSFAPPPADSTVAVLPGYDAAPSRAPHGEKKIEAVEIDGIIQKIIVTCGCGEKIEVHCGY